MTENIIANNLCDEITADYFFDLAVEFAYGSINEPCDETILSFFGFWLYSKKHFVKMSLH